MDIKDLLLTEVILCYELIAKIIANRTKLTANMIIAAAKSDESNNID